MVGQAVIASGPMHSTAPVSSGLGDPRAATQRVMVDFLQMKDFSADPLILVDGDGVWVWDLDGRRYLDSVSGVYTVSLGHRNRPAIEAVKAQLERIAFASPVMTTNLPALELASLLAEVSPGTLNTVKFFSGGSEACEAAIKLARQYHHQSGHPQKYKIIGRYGDYHGATLGALAASGSADAARLYGPLGPGYVFVQSPLVTGCPYCRSTDGCDLACARIIETTIRAEGPDSVAAFIGSPISQTVWPADGYWPLVREICDRYGVLLIYDEIITGFGRLGTLWGSDYVGAAPDILACGKGMGGGYGPLSAILIAEHVASAFWGAEGRQFHHGHTFGGNPLSCAAGIAVLRQILDQDLPARARNLGAYLMDGLLALKRKYAIIAQVRGAGLLTTMFLADPASGAPLRDEAAFARALHRAAR